MALAPELAAVRSGGEKLRWRPNTVLVGGIGRVPARQAARASAYLPIIMASIPFGVVATFLLRGNPGANWEGIATMISFGAVLLLVGFRLLGDKDKVPLRWAISPVGLHFDFGDSERAFPFSSLRSFAWKVKFRYGPSAIITGVDGTSTLVPRISVFALEEMDSAVRRRRPVSEAEVEADNPP